MLKVLFSIRPVFPLMSTIKYKPRVLSSPRTFDATSASPRSSCSCHLPGAADVLLIRNIRSSLGHPGPEDEVKQSKLYLYFSHFRLTLNCSYESFCLHNLKKTWKKSWQKHFYHRWVRIKYAEVFLPYMVLSSVSTKNTVSQQKPRGRSGSCCDIPLSTGGNTSRCVPRLSTRPGSYYTTGHAVCAELI